MRAGMRPHLVTIWRHTDAAYRDDVGQVQQVWTKLCDEWGKVEWLSGQELTDARQVNGRAVARVTIPHRTDVTTDMKLVHGSHEFQVYSAIDRTGLSVDLEVMCAEVV